MSLPTYDQAVTEPDALTLVAPYLDAKSLLALCKVSKHFREVLSPYVWSQPIHIMEELGGRDSKSLKHFNRIAKYADFHPSKASAVPTEG